MAEVRLMQNLLVGLTWLTMLRYGLVRILAVVANPA
jgi:hypothetical protein